LLLFVFIHVFSYFYFSVEKFLVTDWQTVSENEKLHNLTAVCSPAIMGEYRQQQPPVFYGHYTGQPALAGTSS